MQACFDTARMTRDDCGQIVVLVRIGFGVLVDEHQQRVIEQVPSPSGVALSRPTR